MGQGAEGNTSDKQGSYRAFISGAREVQWVSEKRGGEVGNGGPILFFGYREERGVGKGGGQEAALSARYLTYAS
jgi:hypothetical protein